MTDKTTYRKFNIGVRGRFVNLRDVLTSNKSDSQPNNRQARKDLRGGQRSKTWPLQRRYFCSDVKMSHKPIYPSTRKAEVLNSL